MHQSSTLNTIEYDHRGDVETCRRKMEQEWLKQPCPSWCSLVEALQTIDQKAVASEIPEIHSDGLYDTPYLQ